VDPEEQTLAGSGPGSRNYIFNYNPGPALLYILEECGGLLRDGATERAQSRQRAAAQQAADTRGAEARPEAR
jgi:hypothetical protein